MRNEVSLKNKQDILTIIPKLEEGDLPTLINTQVDKLKELDGSVKEAMNAAEKAKKSAQNANEKSAGFGKKKAAIEELQSASVDLAKAVRLGADAQKVSFEFQMKIAEITKYLFSIGMSSIANNRMVVRELEKRLMGASEEEISELAQQELLMVIHQLKEQEDILRKIDNLTSNIHTLKESLISQFDYSRGLNEKIFEHQFTLENYEEQLESLQNESNQYSEKFVYQSELNKQYDEKLSKHQLKLDHHENQFTQQIKVNQKVEERFNEQADLNMNYEEQLKSLQDESSQYSEQFLNQSRKNNEYDQKFKHVEHNFYKIEKNSELVNDRLEEIKSLYEQHQQTLMEYEKVHESIDEQLLKNAESLDRSMLQIQQLVDEKETLKGLVNTKSSATFSKLTLGVATIGTILSILHFFI